MVCVFVSAADNRTLQVTMKHLMCIMCNLANDEGKYERVMVGLC